MKLLGQFLGLTLIFAFSATGVYQMLHYSPVTKTVNGRFPASKKGKVLKETASVSPHISGSLHDDFFKTIDEHYQVYENYGNGTSMCHHFKVENKSDGMRHLMVQMSNFINRRCITETVTMNGPFYLFNDHSQMFFLACCDKVDSNHAVPHFRFERTQDLKNEEIRELRQLIEQK